MEMIIIMMIVNNNNMFEADEVDHKLKIIVMMTIVMMR
jgi:hypothetical protein